MEKGGSMGGRREIVQNYRRFLERALDELIDALREAENANWHHEDAGPWFSHYQRLITWAEEVHHRLRVYNASKRTTQKLREIFPEGTSESGRVV